MVIVGGAEVLLRILNVPQYIMPKPSQILLALYTEWPFLWPHLLITLYELFVGFAIGGAIGFVMAAVITQFPFVEKIVTRTSCSSSRRPCSHWCRCSSCASVSAASLA